MKAEKKEEEERGEWKKRNCFLLPCAAVLYFTDVKANAVFRYKINWKQKKVGGRGGEEKGYQCRY